MKLSHNNSEKVRSQILKMKGKTFTIRLSNGQTLRGSVHGIRGNNVVFKASRITRNGRTQQLGSFFFLFPLLFFFGLFDGII